MKMKDILFYVGFTFVLAFLALTNRAAERPEADIAKIRIGTYNSRAVALAYGRSEIHKQAVAKLYQDYQRAVKLDDQARMAELKKLGSASQDKRHRQVFGSAPIDDILETMKEELPRIQAKAGVTRIMRECPTGPEYEAVDVTSLMVAFFKPDEKTLKYIEDLKKHPPLRDDQFPIKD